MTATIHPLPDSLPELTADRASLAMATRQLRGELENFEAVTAPAMRLGKLSLDLAALDAELAEARKAHSEVLGIWLAQGQIGERPMPSLKISLLEPRRAALARDVEATPATLFYNKASRKLGVVGLKHLVFFDEIANTSFDDAEASISVLKDYMQTGKFSRGDQEFTAPCSVVLGGNIDTDMGLRRPEKRYHHLFQVLPIELQDAAFLDRIHAYLPGWEMPKIVPDNYAVGYGLLTDYMAEIFAELRRRNFQTHVNAWVDMGHMTGRNQDAIKRTTAGLLKLLYPDRSPEEVARDELVPLLDIAVEMRKRVTDQLAKISPGEFSGVEYGYAVRVR